MDNPVSPMARRRETLDTVLVERDHTIADLDATLARLQHDHAAMSQRNAALEAEQKLRKVEIFKLRKKLAQARVHVPRTAKEYVAHKVLSALMLSPLPLGSRTRDRFARSVAKRDSRRSLDCLLG
ncbi:MULTISPECIES: hypothetical protein [unclassified Ruegeria]|uniref:hypothetical protein n=1 Tax=unclassified Ruegeria TaxID=2625375 RepID=UPI0014925079|nr:MULTISPECIES: hypothetical protein [unclassified Ruegeria]NOD34436.1 hypothetical protein [Ruegeria sp. HKCCD7296]NOE34261.1 hypothetical protein [Ruegeria sp. HKCCD7318]NOE40340.1 hypothetical protein [Ruegeria sp. HKCCD7319]